MLDHVRLLLDCNNICHAAYHTTDPSKKHKGVHTGVLYGFLQRICLLCKKYNTIRLVFCFDLGFSKREQDYPEYKARRKLHNLEPEQVEKRKILFPQLDLLRTDILPNMGFENVFFQIGYEADDIIAKICKEKKEKGPYCIVSTDHDMYQLLTHDVSIHTTRHDKEFTMYAFEEKYGIEPSMWPAVKAMAGCDTDGVDGIKGVGERTAIKFLNGDLADTSKASLRIIKKSSQRLIKFNLKLVKLPYEGTPDFKIKKAEKMDYQQWDRVVQQYGMDSLSGMLPGARAY